MRIVWNLIEENKKLKKIEQKNLACYIACCVWGKNPDEIEGEEVKEGIAGIDYPADDRLIGAFF